MEFGMLKHFTLRAWYLGVVLACAGLMAYALYLQHQMFLDPCPLCIFQRVAFIWIGAIALVACIHNPRGVMRGIYAIAVLLGCFAGAAVAGRHVWIQSLPPGEIPECGPGLSYMLETAPFLEVLKTVLLGDGNCAEVSWTFLGLSMPAWTLLWFLGLAAGTLYFSLSRR
jgi:disulfide bond formation protein DsbB